MRARNAAGLSRIRTARNAASFEANHGRRSAIVTVDGEPVLIALPLSKGFASRAMLVDLAAALFDCEQVGLGLAARIAGLSYSEMIDELGQRRIPVVRYSVEDLDREIEYLRTLGDGP